MKNVDTTLAKKKKKEEKNANIANETRAMSST